MSGHGRVGPIISAHTGDSLSSPAKRGAESWSCEPLNGLSVADGYGSYLRPYTLQSLYRTVNGSVPSFVNTLQRGASPPLGPVRAVGQVGWKELAEAVRPRTTTWKGRSDNR
ncbi:hypothetical protein SBV1_3160003 [Verrucomicrobia bacterium]|nr:hypothetical protein SBV1_3160003 [Verrucomicrobiota bacterium]